MQNPETKTEVQKHDSLDVKRATFYSLCFYSERFCQYLVQLNVYRKESKQLQAAIVQQKFKIYGVES